jgi:hypothetical protein
LDWAFDTYISSETKVWVRQTELVAYYLVVNTFLSGYVAGTAACITLVILWGWLLFCNVQKYRSYITGTKERDSQKKIASLSLVHLIITLLIHLIYVIFWLGREMSVGSVKFFTWVWFILLFSSVIVLVTQAILRLLSFKIVPDYVIRNAKVEYQESQYRKSVTDGIPGEKDKTKPAPVEPADNAAPANANNRLRMANDSEESEQAFNAHRTAGRTTYGANRLNQNTTPQEQKPEPQVSFTPKKTATNAYDMVESESEQDPPVTTIYTRTRTRKR